MRFSFELGEYFVTNFDGYILTSSFSYSFSFMVPPSTYTYQQKRALGKPDSLRLRRHTIGTRLHWQLASVVAEEISAALSHYLISISFKGIILESQRRIQGSTQKSFKLSPSDLEFESHHSRYSEILSLSFTNINYLEDADKQQDWDSQDTILFFITITTTSIAAAAPRVTSTLLFSHISCRVRKVKA